jgi:hypothetical protein
MGMARTTKTTKNKQQSKFKSTAFGLLRYNRAFRVFIVISVIALVGSSAYLLGASTAAPSITWTVAYCNGQRIVVSQSRNSRHPCVKAVQVVINDTGCRNSGTRSVDGIFGSGTASAVRCYQRTFSLGVDGIVGPQTWADMNRRCIVWSNHSISVRHYCY